MSSSKQVFDRGDRVGIYLQDKHSLQENLELVQYAEEQGDRRDFGRRSLDSHATASRRSARTPPSRIRSNLGPASSTTGRATHRTHRPDDEHAGGTRRSEPHPVWDRRLVDPLAEKVGIDRSGALRAMQECVEVTQDLLDMENVTYDGEFVQMRDVELDVVHGDSGPRTVPVYVGGTGFKKCSSSRVTLPTAP